MMLLRLGIALAGLLVAVAAAADSSKWPERPIRVVLPFPGGGSGDVLTRLVGEELRARFGQPVVVDNRPGGGGNIGTAAVAQAAPDGHTLLMGATNNFAINQFLYKDLGFDPLQALSPITVVADVPAVIFVNAGTPARSVTQFAAWAKASRGKLNYATPGAGTTTHLSTELINRTLDMGLTHVPYKGGAPAMAALLAGDVHFYLVAAGSGAPLVKAGKLAALAVSSPGRLAAMPDVPTFTEAGLGAIRASNSWILAAPRGLPADIAGRIHATVRDWAATPAARQRLEEFGFVAVVRPPEETRTQLAAEALYWQKAIRDTGARLE